MTVEKKDIDWGSLGFGYMKTDYSYEAHWKDGEWDRVNSPSCSVTATL